MYRYFLATLCLLFLGQAQAEVQIVTSIKPLQLIAQSIQGEHGTTHNLLPAGASPHSFSLRPSDRKLLAQADLFYWIGPDMENFLVNLAAQHSAISHSMQQLEQLHLLHYEQTQDSHSHHSHDHDHQPGALDTHLWLSGENALIIASKITADLSRLDPANSASYQDNLEKFSQQLKSTEQQIHQLLEPIRQQKYFVFHESLNYFEHSYGLQHSAVFAINPEVQPGARHLHQMRQQLQQAGSSCILTEPPAPPRIATSLSKDLPVRLQQIDVLGHQADSYPQLLLELAQSIAACWQ